MQLLREFVVQVLRERLQGAGQFKLSEFKRLTDPFKMMLYVDDVLKPLGEGTSRATYLLSSSKVLKLARHDNEEKGRAQNQSEVDVSTNPVTRPLVTKVFDYDPSFNWLISELVRPVTDAEMKAHLGISPRTVFDALYEIANADKSVDEFFANKGRLGALFKPATRQFMAACLEMMNVNDLTLGDIEVVKHWGKTADGRIVLLDYGLTGDVYDSHYNKKKKADGAADDDDNTKATA